MIKYERDDIRAHEEKVLASEEMTGVKRKETKEALCLYLFPPSSPPSLLSPNIFPRLPSRRHAEASEGPFLLGDVVTQASCIGGPL